MAEGSSSTTNQNSLAMRATLFSIRNAFPKVKQLQTEDLQCLLDKKRTAILLDVREIDEYKVSHLANAIFIKPDQPIEEVISKILDKVSEQCNNKCVNVVAYCSLGYRSSTMAQKIYHELKMFKEAGNILPEIQVYNLEGSIFKWANEGRTMVDCENVVTKYCHPYSIVWGKLLDYNLRKYNTDTENTS